MYKHHKIKAKICWTLREFGRVHYMTLITSFHTSHQLDALDVLTEMYATGHIMSSYGNASLVVPESRDQRQAQEWYREIIQIQVRRRFHERPNVQTLHPLNRKVIE